MARPQNSGPANSVTRQRGVQTPGAVEGTFGRCPWINLTDRASVDPALSRLRGFGIGGRRPSHLCLAVWLQAERRQEVGATYPDARIGLEGAQFRIKQMTEGIAGLAAFCRAAGVALIVMEAIGGYERLPFGLLWADGIPCVIANTRGVRRLADALGFLEKTDRIDAGVIAQYDDVKALKPQPPRATTRNGFRPSRFACARSRPRASPRWPSAAWSMNPACSPRLIASSPASRPRYARSRPRSLLSSTPIPSGRLAELSFLPEIGTLSRSFFSVVRGRGPDTLTDQAACAAGVKLAEAPASPVKSTRMGRGRGGVPATFRRLAIRVAPYGPQARHLTLGCSATETPHGQFGLGYAPLSGQLESTTSRGRGRGVSRKLDWFLAECEKVV